MGELERRPEELFNRYMSLQIATANIASALGFLALLWSTVVLLGGLVRVLRLKDFWVVTALSFLMAFRMAKIGYHEITKGIYVEEAKIIYILMRHKRICSQGVVTTIMMLMALMVKVIFASCFELLFHVSPFVSLGFSVWRLVQRDYGNAGGDTANRVKLIAALDIFYALTLFQGFFSLYLVVFIIRHLDSWMGSSVVMHCGLGDEEWGGEVVRVYRLETRRKFSKDGVVPYDWNLIAYGVELLQSTSGDDHLWGVRVLDQLYDKDPSLVTQKLMFSKLSIMNLIGMIGLRGTDDDYTEKRERTARILAHLASDLSVTQFPGTLQCICSLLESSRQSCELRVTCPSGNPDEHSLPDKRDEYGADTVLHIKNQTEHESGGASREMISQGLQILERLTQDEENCTEISKHHRLLSKLTSPLRSHDFLNNTAMVEMLRISLTVVSRLLASPGDGATRLRQKLATNTEAVSNLMAILENDSQSVQELHEQALEILTELVIDDSFTKLSFSGSACMLNKLFKTLQRIFLEEDSSTMVAEPEREKGIRLRGQAGEALARLLPVYTARDANSAGILPEQDVINLMTKVVYQILSSKMGTTAGAAIGSRVSNEKQSEERKLMAAMLSVAVVMCNENVISKEDFVRATSEDAALVKKLKEVLESNKHSTPECLRVVKLTCQVVIAMIQAKPSCIQHFSEHNFKEALTEALGIMSEIDDCMLFAGNDREAIKPERSLASLVKEARKLLETAQDKQGTDSD